MATLKNVTPWGRVIEEYRLIFSLTKDDLTERILDCGSGPASFNASLTANGGHVVSIDPIYEHEPSILASSLNQNYESVKERFLSSLDEFVWKTIPTKDDLLEMRKTAMELFLADYPSGKAEGRYRAERLPTLPFSNGSFGLALCSHLLFYYAEQLDFNFHISSIKELCRVAPEVRIFPLVELESSDKSRHLAPAISALESQGYSFKIEPVKYEVLKGANEMLRVRAPLESLHC